MARSFPRAHRAHRFGGSAAAPPFAFLPLAPLVALLAASCGDDGPVEPEENRAPTATISAPATGASFVTGEEIGFEGSGEDPEDGALRGGALVWTSDLDGEIGTGTSFTRSDLTAGEHIITLTATDSEGASGADAVSIAVTEPPSASIEAPADGATTWEGNEITFEATAADAEGEPLTGEALEWRSDRDGSLGTGETVTHDDLSPGDHEITLTASDARGGEATVGVSISVTVPAIAQPSAGAVFLEGDDIVFEASVEPPDGEDLTLTWMSDADGALGNEDSFARSDLGVGEHRVTLEIAGSGGSAATLEVDIHVAAPFALEGTLEPLPGHQLTPLEVHARSSGFHGTAAVEPDGTFQATIPDPAALDSLALLVDAPQPEERVHFPVHINFGGTVPESQAWLPPDVAPDTILHHVRAALVPPTWTIEDGPYAGQEVPVSLEAGNEEAQDGASFFFSHDIGSLLDASWPTDNLPVPVAFHHDSTTVAITTADSIAFWEGVDRFQDRFGEELFAPAVLPPDSRILHEDWITVRVDTTLGPTAMADPRWHRPGASVGPPPQVSLWSGALHFREAEGLSNEWLVMHEMAHLLGHGHTCAWGSILGGSSSGCSGSEDPTPEDVAAEQLKRAVANLRLDSEDPDHSDRIMFGLEYSRLGERVAILGLPPYEDPSGETATASAPWIEPDARGRGPLRGRLVPD